jgi:hypothetical protein
MSSTEEERVMVRVGQNGPLKGVLVHLKSRRQKKSVTWKDDGLETIKYFELDETERGKPSDCSGFEIFSINTYYGIS